MQIKWRKTSTTIEGSVGDVLVFHMIPEAGQVQLVCDLPEALPNMYGRLVTHHHSAKEAAKRAQNVLDNWYKRFMK